MLEALEISEAISLAIAPVFLLVAVGGLLNVMTSRLGRAVDRIRDLEDLALHEDPGPERALHIRQLNQQDARIVRINVAITLSVIAALLVCFVIGTIFAAEFLDLDLSHVVAVLFMTAMLAMIVSLGFFLSEIYVAARLLRVRDDFRTKKRKKT